MVKALVLTVLWTLGYWLCFGITYGYNAYFWDNSIAQNLIFSVVCWWIFGVMVIAMMALLSTAAKSNTGVFLGTGGLVLASYLIGLVPKCSKYLPAYLANGTSLIYGLAEVKAYMPSLMIAIAESIICFATGIPIFNKKQL